MKATCYGCRALEGSQTYRCALGYAQTNGRDGPRPLAECPKPRTNAGLCHWYGVRQANGGRPPRFEAEDRAAQRKHRIGA